MLNVQEIRELVKLIDDSSINEFEYESNGSKITMKKQDHEVATIGKETPSLSTQNSEVKKNEQAKEKEEIPSVQVESTPVKEEEESKNGDQEIVSPMVGTFYNSPTPESDTYVQKGDKVKADTVVCIVEAMKLFNEIESEVSGEIVEVLVENGELVEYGQPLFKVKSA